MSRFDMKGVRLVRLSTSASRTEVITGCVGYFTARDVWMRARDPAESRMFWYTIIRRASTVRGV